MTAVCSNDADDETDEKGGKTMKRKTSWPGIASVQQSTWHWLPMGNSLPSTSILRDGQSIVGGFQARIPDYWAGAE
jgi:hypothetical protein